MLRAGGPSCIRCRLGSGSCITGGLSLRLPLRGLRSSDPDEEDVVALPLSESESDPDPELLLDPELVPDPDSDPEPDSESELLLSLLLLEDGEGDRRR